MARGYNWRYQGMAGTIAGGIAGNVYRRWRYGYYPFNSQNKILGTNTMANAKTKASGSRTKKYRRRNYRRKFYRKRIPRLQPWSTCVKLKTISPQSIDGAAGVLTTQVYCLNGCYDPFLANDTAQPLGFDQWATLYRKYCVIGWKVKVELVTKDNSNAAVVGFAPSTSSTALASYMHYKESPANRSVTLTPDIDKSMFVTKGSIEKFLFGGRRRGKILSDDETTALCTANPVRPVYGHLYVQAFDATSDIAAVLANITIEQIVVFFDPIIPGRS